MKFVTKKAGSRIGYILGGFLLLVLGSYITALYLPSALFGAFNLPPMWNFTEVLLFGGKLDAVFNFFLGNCCFGLLLIVLFVLFVSLYTRRSPSSNRFRWAGILGLLAVLCYSTNLLLVGTFDALGDVPAYLSLAFAVLSLLVLVLAFTRCAKDRDNENRASVVLIINSIFWVLMGIAMALIFAGTALNLFDAFFTSEFGEALGFITSQPTGFISVLFLITGILMLCTSTIYVKIAKVETPKGLEQTARPKVIMANTEGPIRKTLAEVEEMEKGQQGASIAQTAQKDNNMDIPSTQPKEARFKHDYTDPTEVVTAENKTPNSEATQQANDNGQTTTESVQTEKDGVAQQVHNPFAGVFVPLKTTKERKTRNTPKPKITLEVTKEIIPDENDTNKALKKVTKTVTKETALPNAPSKKVITTTTVVKPLARKPSETNVVTNKTIIEESTDKDETVTE